MKTLEEFYKRLRALITELDSKGQTESADQLRNAMLGGSTSGEVLERVWFALKSLEQVYVRDEPDIHDLLVYIDETLEPSSGGQRD